MKFIVQTAKFIIEHVNPVLALFIFIVIIIAKLNLRKTLLVLRRRRRIRLSVASIRRLNRIYSGVFYGFISLFIVGTVITALPLLLVFRAYAPRNISNKNIDLKIDRELKMFSTQHHCLFCQDYVFSPHPADCDEHFQGIISTGSHVRPLVFYVRPDAHQCLKIKTGAGLEGWIPDYYSGEF